jgi:hypothetical protein
VQLQLTQQSAQMQLVNGQAMNITPSDPNMPFDVMNDTPHPADDPPQLPEPTKRVNSKGQGGSKQTGDVAGLSRNDYNALVTQLYWREFYYYIVYWTPNILAEGDCL